MKPKTEEFLYVLLWFCETLARPTWRNLDEGFESWAYRKGLFRQLAALERRKLVEVRKARDADARLVRLTATGRLHALGGRDPEAAWSRPWDGQWRLALFDIPQVRNSARVRLRRCLKARGFGYLQNSVWITPDPVVEERGFLGVKGIDVESLVLMEARPCGGETNAQIVTGAWDFGEIHRAYARYLRVLDGIPMAREDSEVAARALRRWATEEREAWLAAVSMDPLLPTCLLPPGYLGRTAWGRRIELLEMAARQLARLVA